MQSVRNGGAAPMVVGLLVVAFIAGVVWYFVSDPFRTKVDSAMTAATTWTPENIAKDPTGYLNWCEAQTKKAIESLSANKISVAQSRAKLETMVSDAKRKIGVGEKAVEELKQLYTKAEESKSWPVTWNGAPHDREKVKLQTVTLHRQVENQKSILAKAEAGIAKLNAQDSKILEAQARANEQLANITANREMLKVNSLTSDLKEKLVSMQSVMQATIDAASDTSGTVSIDQLDDASAGTVSDDEFQKILGGGTKPQ
jgi:hypothetical protein